MTYKTILQEIIRSAAFEKELKNIDEYFFNIKQELHIRDVLVRLLSAKLGKSAKAFSEFPRGHHNEQAQELKAPCKQGGQPRMAVATEKNEFGRRDIGIIRNTAGGKPQTKIYTIELKYHYAGDLFTKGAKPKVKRNKDINQLKKDWERKPMGHACNCFLLITCFRPWLPARGGCGVVAEDREHVTLCTEVIKPGKMSTKLKRAYKLLAQEITTSKSGAFVFYPIIPKPAHSTANASSKTYYLFTAIFQ